MTIPPVNVFALGMSAGIAFTLMIMPTLDEPTEITAAVFGMRDAELEEFPFCQTDLKMSDMWSTRLMYLNGAWTAGCIDQALKLKEQRLDDMEHKHVPPQPRDVPL